MFNTVDVLPLGSTSIVITKKIQNIYNHTQIFTLIFHFLF